MSTIARSTCVQLSCAAALVLSLVAGMSARQQEQAPKLKQDAFGNVVLPRDGSLYVYVIPQGIGATLACREWVRTPRSSMEGRIQQEWVVGYLVGYGSLVQLQVSQPEETVRSLTYYCETHPDDTVLGATVQYAHSLRDRAGVR